MRFSDDQQLAAVCSVLTKTVHHKGINWTSSGPTQAALAVMMAMDARTVWDRVLTYTPDTLGRSARKELGDNCSALSIEDDRTLVLWCETATTIKRMEEVVVREGLSEVLCYHGVKSLRFTTVNPEPYLSGGEGLMVRVAWSMWNGRCTPPLNDLWGRLDEPSFKLVAGLFVALASGQRAVDLWLETHGNGS